MTNALTTLSQAERALATITDIPEALELRDRAEAVRHYARAADLGLSTQNEASRIKILAERKVGQLLREMKQHDQLSKGGNPNLSHDATGCRLEDLGLSRSQSSRYQQVAALPDEKFNELVAECDEKQVELTSTLVRRRATGAHVSHNSGDCEWFTPPEFVNAARQVMGGIDLDPASSEAAQQVVAAETFYSEADDGLSHQWRGRVWMNPPYGKQVMPQFCERLKASLLSGDVSQACVLVNNGTETGWFQSLASECAAICFPSGRISFWHPDKDSKSPLQGQAVLYAGERVEQFTTVFGAHGLCVAVTSTRGQP